MLLRLTTFLTLLVCCFSVESADWPTYRAGPRRDGAGAGPLPTDLAARWVHRSHVPVPAWPSSERQGFDRVSHVVVADGLLSFAGSADGRVQTLDAATGAERWSFFTDAPVRVTPVLWKGRVFAASDDGFLYCLDAKTGELYWKQRGGPSSEMILGNDRLCSAWPARGGPVIEDGNLYWAAGIWPSDGIFIHALDAESGEKLWTNDTDGARHMPQPHGGANARSGLSAQGHLVVDGDTVYLPTGRAVPAALGLEDGKFRYFHLQKYGHSGGTSVVALGDRFHNGGRLYDRESGLETGRLAGIVARLGDSVAQATSAGVGVYRRVEKKKVDRKGKERIVVELEQDWKLQLPGKKHEIITAGAAIIVGEEGRVSIIDTLTRTVTWSADVEGNAGGLAVADGRLLVSTDEGLLYCFAKKEGDSAAVPTAPARALPSHAERWADAADAILEATGLRDGYCVDLGCGDGTLALELARQSRLQIYCVDSDPGNVAAAREKLDRAGLYGVRVSVHLRDLATTTYPKFFANLVVSQRSIESEDFELDHEEVRRLTRPWGGTSCLGPADALRVARRGALEGAGSWTHQYSDPANTCCSDDARVKGPLRMLWFRDADLPMPQRHGRAPAPLFHQGYLAVEGLDAVRVSDAYNGRTLWEHALPGILAALDQDHLMGTAGTGSNLCIGGDSIYVHRKTHCLRLDLASGRELGEFPPPKRPDGKPGVWGYLAHQDGVLYGTVANTDHIVKWRYLKGDMSDMLSESFSLFALDAKTGKLLWQRPAKRSIRHNAIAMGGGRVYLIDREIAKIDSIAYRRGKDEENAPHATGELIALDAKTGEVAWRMADDVYGTTLALSVDESALLMSYQPTSFRLPSEVGGRMAVFHTKNGYRLWDKKVNYGSRPLLVGKTVYAQGGAWDVKSGVERSFPFERSYGCGILAGGKNLFVFRSATMGYWDLTENRKIRNYGGLRLGCWINAIPAGGLVLVPDGSAGCKCSYLNRASMALQSAD